MTSCLHPLVESLFPDSASLRYPRCKSKLAGDCGAAGRASAEGLRHRREAGRPARTLKTGSDPRSEERLGFGDFLGGREKEPGSLTRALILSRTTEDYPHLPSYFAACLSLSWVGLGFRKLFHIWSTPTLESEELCNRVGLGIRKRHFRD